MHVHLLLVLVGIGKQAKHVHAPVLVARMIGAGLGRRFDDGWQPHFFAFAFVGHRYFDAGALRVIRDFLFVVYFFFIICFLDDFFVVSSLFLSLFVYFNFLFIYFFFSYCMTSVAMVAVLLSCSVYFFALILVSIGGLSSCSSRLRSATAMQQTVLVVIVIAHGLPIMREINKRQA